MGQFMSNKYIRYSDALRGRLIEKDKPCRYCGYNLRGLRLGGRCPECGTTIVLENSLQDALVHAPLQVIRRLRLGFWLAVVLLPALMLLPFAVVRTGSPSELFAGGLCMIAVAWTVSVWMMTPAIEVPAGVRRGFGAGSKLRWAARLLQLGWPLSMMSMIGAMMLMPAVGPMPTLAAFLGLASGVSALAGLAGVVVLSVLLRRLAEWCSDDLAGKMLDWTSIGIPLCAIVCTVSFAVPILALVGCFFIIVFVITMLCFALAMALLARAVTWSVHHAHEAQQRDKRRGRAPEPERATQTPGPASAPGDEDVIPLAGD